MQCFVQGLINLGCLLWVTESGEELPDEGFPIQIGITMLWRNLESQDFKKRDRIIQHEWTHTVDLLYNLLYWMEHTQIMYLHWSD